MKTSKLVLIEMFQRWQQLFSSLLAFTLGIAIIVAIKNITIFSEKAIAQEMESLGANILILPKSATVQDYYSADFQDEEIPESYIEVLQNSEIQGIENLSPKLNLPVVIQNHEAILTGILSKNEMKAKNAWLGTTGAFTITHGCANPAANSAGGRRQAINDLGENEVILGQEIAAKLKLSEGEFLEIKGHRFQVAALLPATGMVDDNRIFAHLRTVQRISNKNAVLNAIEIVGCCSQISKGLIQEINRLLPEAKVVTIAQIVQTQLNTNNLMNNLSSVILIIIILIGGASMANYMFANVYERRREIGILMAMGAKTARIVKIFLLKAFFIGIMGGVTGALTGTLLAVIAGPSLTGYSITPLPILGLYGLLLSIIVSLLASIIPVIKATRVDPFVIMQEE